MKAVVMECRFRVCATHERFQKFADRAAALVAATLADRYESSRIVESSTSPLLRQHWDDTNGAGGLPAPQLWELSLAFVGDATLTAAVIESLSRDILKDLEPDPDDPTSETVPWILTLTTATDPRSRREVFGRHPSLNVDRPVPVGVG